jgi:hypothetical protein
MNEAVWLQRAHRSALWIFGFSSLLTIVLGAVVMAQGAVPLGIWVRNPIAWLVAGAVAIFMARRGWFGGWAVPVALAVVALTFFGPGQDGVHRWLGLGPVQLNGAALVLPLAIVVFERAHPVVAAIGFVLIAALLAWQPDISQLAGFALAAFVLGAARFGWLGAGISLALAAAAIAVCLSRPDPLEPVAYVEGIFALAWSQSPAIAIAMGLALAGAVLNPLMIRSAHLLGVVTPLALVAYLGATTLAPFLGAYPVPLAGYGLSFVVGWWLAFAALCARPDRNSSPQSAAAAIP